MKALFMAVAEISLSTGVIVALLLALSPLLHKRYAAKWKYGVWILLALRLLIPVQLTVPKRQITLTVPSSVMTPTNPVAEPTTIAVGPAGPVEGALSQSQGIVPLDVIAWVWLIGAVLFLAVHLASYWIYKRNILKNGTRVTDLALLQQIRSISKELGMQFRIPIIQDPNAGSPMVLGFFRPILVLPEMDYPVLELYFVLKHELVHLKRRDVFSKLLFVMANAVHWFNPVVYLLRQEAVVDMELSCDERVVRGTVYETRKAYTETLLNTLTRQQVRTTALTTQFYGGKEVMKKRFRNILSREGKRNGAVLLLAAVVVIGVLGASVRLTSVDWDDPTPVGDEIFKTARNFASAYERGDREAMKTWLDHTYEGDWEVYPEADASAKGGRFNVGEDRPKLGDISNNSFLWPSVWDKTVPVGSTYTIYLYQNSNYGDHLIVSLVNREDGWKIRDYTLVEALPALEATDAAELEAEEETSARQGNPVTEEDSRRVEALVKEFAGVFFDGASVEMLRTYAATPYEGFSDSFANYSGLVSIEHYRNLPKAGDILPEDGRVAVVIDFYTKERPDSYTYLQLELLKQDAQWKIYSCVVDV